jgi:hypothetical protein
MIPRIFTNLCLLLTLIGCVSPKAITKDELVKSTRHWKEPKVAIWHYVGSKNGFDYFDYRDLGVHQVYCVESGQITLPRTFPMTRDERSWIVMPWGPASAQNISDQQAAAGDGDKSLD